MNLTPEQTKRIAEFAGWERIKWRPYLAKTDVYQYRRKSDGYIVDNYTPDTDDAQAFELLRKLLHAGDWEVSAQDETQFLAWSESRYIDESEGLSNEPSHFISESLNLAICHAALALLDNTENDNG